MRSSAAIVLYHIDRTPTRILLRIGNNMIDRVGSIIDQCANRTPSASIVGTQKRTAKFQLTANRSFISRQFFLQHISLQTGCFEAVPLAVDCLMDAYFFNHFYICIGNRENASGHIARGQGDQQRIRGPTNARRTRFGRFHGARCRNVIALLVGVSHTSPERALWSETEECSTRAASPGPPSGLPPVSSRIE